MQKICYLYPNPTDDTHETLSHKVDKLLAEGWRVVSVTAQHVSVSTGGQTYTCNDKKGGWCVVLEKDKN